MAKNGLSGFAIQSTSACRGSSSGVNFAVRAVEDTSARASCRSAGSSRRSSTLAEAKYGGGWPKLLRPRRVKKPARP